MHKMTLKWLGTRTGPHRVRERSLPPSDSGSGVQDRGDRGPREQGLTVGEGLGEPHRARQNDLLSARATISARAGQTMSGAWRSKTQPWNGSHWTERGGCAAHKVALSSAAPDPVPPPWSVTTGSLPCMTSGTGGPLFPDLSSRTPQDGQRQRHGRPGTELMWVSLSGRQHCWPLHRPERKRKNKNSCQADLVSLLKCTLMCQDDRLG